MTFELVDEKRQQHQAVIKFIDINYTNYFWASALYINSIWYDVKEKSKFTYHNNVGENPF